MRLSEVAATVVGQTIYLAGGLTAEGRASDRFFAFDVPEVRWKELARMPAPLHHVAMVSQGDQIFVIGGYDDGWTAQDRIYRYSVKSDGWEVFLTLKRPIAAATAQVLGNEIHIFGGARKGHAVNDHAIVDLERLSVVDGVSLRVAREHLSSAVMGKRIYVVGGRAPSGGRINNLGTLEIYDADTGVLSEGPPMPTPRSGIAAVAVKGMVMVFGGESETRTFGEVEAYDVNRGSWTSLTYMPTPRHGLAAATVGNRVYVIAGGPRPGLTVSDVNDVLILE
ncbi:MAG: hypothetical protein NYU90_07010 [Aigarchaeota archaeon]|nr:hypothetical protein [Candidatus Calditenuis fumarioli]